MKVILVVESDETMRENIGEILEISGYRVAYAVDGLEGLQKIFNLLPDLVVYNVNLSGIAGEDIWEAVGMSPKTNGIPFILLTPTSGGDELIKNVNTGSKNFLAIPFEYEQLINEVDRILKPIRYSLKNVS